MSDDIDDILDSIFDVIDLPDPRIKLKLRQGLARGLEVATELGQDVKVELDLDPDSPGVVVLDGGREPTDEVAKTVAAMEEEHDRAREARRAGEAANDADHSDSDIDRDDDGDGDGDDGTQPVGKPELSVHRRDELEDLDEDDFTLDDFDSLDDLEDLIDDYHGQAGFDGTRPGAVRVKVIDSRRMPQALGRDPQREAPIGAGRIDVTDDIQTLFRGSSPAIYRVYCEDGELTVRLDGRSVETLAPGQSMDVESRRVQVEGDGEGWYAKV